MATGGVVANRIVVGLTQYTAGANGLITDGDCIGTPATDAGVYAVGCTLYQRDSSTSYATVVWQNTGTTAVPVWTNIGAGRVISATVAGATLALTSAQSGATILFDKVDGIVVTLPTPVIGNKFTFVTVATVTSNSYKVITSAGTIFIAGAITGAVDNTAVKSWVGNGTSHIAVTQAAASTNATGGILGGRLEFICTTALQWNCTGFTVAGGTPTTPFATS